MTIRKRGARYHYDFMIRRQRYRGALPEAGTKAEAQQAEAKIKNKIYERRYGKTSTSRSFAEFVRTTYLPWAKATKRSSRDDVLHAEVFCRHFGNKNLSEIDHQMIEEFKIKRMNHTFGTRLADAGVDVVKIKELMGHASIVTTMRYIHATDQGKRGAITVLSEYRQRRRHKFVTDDKRQTLQPAVSH